MISEKGFTLVELLIVIAIIGVLAGVIVPRISSARNIAKASGTKSTLSSLKGAIANCCVGTTNYLQDMANADVCSTGNTSNLPSNDMLSAGTVTYTVVSDCNTENPAIDVEIINHPLPACDGHISVTQDGIFSGGDASTVGTTAGFPAGC